MTTYLITTAFGVRKWDADSVEHALEQHDDAFGGEADEAVTGVTLARRNAQGECAFCAFMEPGDPAKCSNCGCVHAVQR